VVVKWSRFDISEVAPQGGYVAKQCPARAQFDELRPAEPLPPSPAALRRMAEGVAFEADVFAQLADRVPGTLLIERAGPDDRDGPDDRADRERRTVAAMSHGAPLILGGRLPAEESARRVGEPDVLIAAVGGGYHPADVKHHRTLTDRPTLPAVIAELEAPERSAAVEEGEVWSRKSKYDLLQLAHYRRMLQACGHAAVPGAAGADGATGPDGPDGPDGAAAIIGSELRVTWYDLDAAIWRTPSHSEGTRTRSTMGVYDFEYAFRLDIIEVARRHRRDPSVALLVVPVRTSECASCPWWDHCRPWLDDADDVSLLPGSSWRTWVTHRDRGVATIHDLASLDRRTARLVDLGVDLIDLGERIADEPDDTPIDRVLNARRHVQIARLADAGVLTVGDARRLDQRVVPYSESTLKSLEEWIDLALARSGDSPVHLRRGVDRLKVHRADVEVDLDLENTADGVYLWGALVTDRAGTGLVEPGYRAFITWEPDPSVAEVQVFEQMCRWLDQLRSSATAAGHSVAVYCFHESAEAGAMRRLAASPDAGSDWSAWVEELVGSADWVDLLQVARRQLITGASMGLKALAPLAGFEWEDDDPGGEQSMEWHRLAVADPDAAVRDAQRARLLTYNRNDTEATLALREWMDSGSADVPNIDAEG